MGDPRSDAIVVSDFRLCDAERPMNGAFGQTLQVDASGAEAFDDAGFPGVGRAARWYGCPRFSSVWDRSSGRSGKVATSRSPRFGMMVRPGKLRAARIAASAVSAMATWTAVAERLRNGLPDLLRRAVDATERIDREATVSGASVRTKAKNRAAIWARLAAGAVNAGEHMLYPMGVIPSPVPLNLAFDGTYRLCADRFDFHFAQQALNRAHRPGCFLALEFEHQRSAGSG